MGNSAVAMLCCWELCNGTLSAEVDGGFDITTTRQQQIPPQETTDEEEEEVVNYTSWWWSR